MSQPPKILAFAGSLRKDSFNKKMVKIAIKGAEAAGAQVTYIDLKDYPLPIYDQEIEESEGLPENALKLKSLMQTHDGFLIANPEYNSSVSAAIKNVIDWASRPAKPDEANLSCFTGKFILLMSASPGGLGGLRALAHLKEIFGNISCVVLPQQKCIPNAFAAFGADGNLKDAKQQQEVIDLGKTLTKFIASHSK